MSLEERISDLASRGIKVEMNCTNLDKRYTEDYYYNLAVYPSSDQDAIVCLGDDLPFQPDSPGAETQYKAILNHHNLHPENTAFFIHYTGDWSKMLAGAWEDAPNVPEYWAGTLGNIVPVARAMVSGVFTAITDDLVF